MKTIQTIIFDLDGTLIDSKKDIINSVKFTLNKLNLKEKNDEEITSYIGTGVEDLLIKSTGSGNEDLISKALEIFKKYFAVHSTDNSKLYPGVKDILDYFKNKKKAIITNRRYEFAVANLKSFKIYDYFDSIAGGDEIKCAKPSPCPLEKVIKNFNTQKTKAVMVGDMDIDIISGKQAGIITCGVTYGIGKKQDILKAGPDYIINNILKLKELFN